jgi:hypothetical protein
LHAWEMVFSRQTRAVPYNKSLVPPDLLDLS